MLNHWVLGLTAATGLVSYQGMYGSCYAMRDHCYYETHSTGNLMTESLIYPLHEIISHIFRT